MLNCAVAGRGLRSRVALRPWIVRFWLTAGMGAVRTYRHDDASWSVSPLTAPVMAAASAVGLHGTRTAAVGAARAGRAELRATATSRLAAAILASCLGADRGMADSSKEVTVSHRRVPRAAAGRGLRRSRGLRRAGS